MYCLNELENNIVLMCHRLIIRLVDLGFSNYIDMQPLQY